MPFFTAALAGARFVAPDLDAAPTGDFFAPPTAATSPDAFPAGALFLAGALAATVLAEPAAAAATFFTPSATPAAA